jgi:hypothetical protein
MEVLYDYFSIFFFVRAFFYFSMYGYGRTAILFCIRDEMDDGRWGRGVRPMHWGVPRWND